MSTVTVTDRHGHDRTFKASEFVECAPDGEGYTEIHITRKVCGQHLNVSYVLRVREAPWEVRERVRTA